jgi:hypothetical protein
MLNFADFRSDVPGIVPELSIESVVGEFGTSVPDPSICTLLFVALGIRSPHNSVLARRHAGGPSGTEAATAIVLAGFELQHSVPAASDELVSRRTSDYKRGFELYCSPFGAQLDDPEQVRVPCYIVITVYSRSALHTCKSNLPDGKPLR